MGKQIITDLSQTAADAFTRTVDQLVIEKLGPIAGLTANVTFADDKFAGTPTVPNAIQNDPSIKI